MSKLIPLQDDVKEIFEECISNIRNQILKSEYLNCTEDIILDTKEYTKRMELGTVHKMKSKESIKNVTKEQMIKVYDTKLSKKGQPGRKYYDKIISLPEYGMCPYCGQRTAATLDHFMPKSKYTSLVVTPSNLVPSCIDCNKLKLDSTFTTREDTFINPYFTDLHEKAWLIVKIIPEENDFVVEFTIDKDVLEDATLYKRYMSFFDMLELNKLYISHSAQALVGLKKRLAKIYAKAGGKEGVIQDLCESMEQEAYPLNHWKIALYRALLSDQWFLEEWLAKQNT